MSEENDQSPGAEAVFERPSIRVLPDRVINQIAAGEVVERPAAVVKELLENALDARADRIEIEFRGGGKSLIRVEDNGIGMPPDEALIALERHATSKLRDAADLAKVLSLGFRGEALPSIASVSRFTLRTRARGWEHGTEIFVNGGRMVHQRECGMPTGTRIEVANLFNSVPARRKFLKSDATESAHITHLVRLHAVARPGVSFSLIENGRSVFSSPKCPDMRERVAEIWGRELADELVELEPAEGENGLRLTGLVGKPGAGRATRRQMIALVNGRPVDSRTLNYALIEGYHSFIPKGRYPLAFLFLEIDPAVIDVNIHPAKREIKFRDEGRVRQFVLQAVVRQLQALAARARHPILQGGREDFEIDVLPRRERSHPVVGRPGRDEEAKPGHAGADSRVGKAPASRPAEGQGESGAAASEPAPRPVPSPALKPGAYPRTRPGPVSEQFREKYLKPDPNAAPGADATATDPGKKPSAGDERAGEEGISDQSVAPAGAEPPSAEPATSDESKGGPEKPAASALAGSPVPADDPTLIDTPASAQAPARAPVTGEELPVVTWTPAQPGSRAVSGGEASEPEFRFQWRCLGLLREGYALFETPSGLVVMDRRAAHERVWFERLQARFSENEQPSQRLLFPVGLELEPLASAALEENLPALQAHGFGIEPFGKNFFRLESHPDWLPEAETETFVRDLIERLREGSLDLSRPAVADEALARLAVRRAIRPADGGGCEEMTELARALLQCQQPLNCPRGRPTYFELSNRELARRFGR
ncbi:DNA mismatch repair endonuclease MutL [Ruficoccus amylovorans]|uniref:DNA mismatch repair protein MutL n=1 Tax=Ruficoccus amylovorans TaxID=1804625 RepID=A0A842HAN2_9BACT|nr:DNA mismatch repair endonuclease MutL [Ruficoccus amylovorans]MBC2593405.1 DNA mismatch repair endonuclease MutL [Ruficoccus amylovorans]